MESEFGEGRGENDTEVASPGHTDDYDLAGNLRNDHAQPKKPVSPLHVEVSRAAQLEQSVAEAPEEELENSKSIGLHSIVEDCATFDQIGVALSWHLVNSDSKASMSDARIWIDVFGKATKPERHGLPLPLGDLEDLVEFLKSSSLKNCCHPDEAVKRAEEAWLFLTFYGINSLYGLARQPIPGRWLAHQRRAAETLRSHVQRFRKSALGVERKVTVDEVERELKAKRVNYSGEELLLCHPLTLRQILPSLPPAEHGGCVDSLEWVGEVTRFFLTRPNAMVIEDKGQNLPKLQGKINIVKEDLEDVIGELCRRNVCDWVPLDEVLHYRGQPVLNGMFGVEKPQKLGDNSPVLRVIMNLVPSNSVHHQLTGGTSSLPFIGQWLSVVLDGSQEIRTWQSDMSSAFYLFSLPRAWWGHLSFNILKRGHEIGLASNRLFALSCKVIPMGFNSSVSVMQEISENLLRDVLPLGSRVSRRRQLPPWLTAAVRESATSQRAWYHIYLDNFCAAARIEPPESGSEGHCLHNLAEEAWKKAGVVSSVKKRKSELKQAEELGCYIDGEERTLGISPERALKLCQTSLHLCSRGALNRKMTQVVAGRWVHAFQFRRPLMSCLDVTWSYIGRSRNRKFSYDEVRREFMRAVALLPLAHTHLGAKVSNYMGASDASGTGGAVGMSRRLSPTGRDFVGASLEAIDKVKEIPVLVISLFNGIGGSLRCYDILGVRPAGAVIVDICKEANRICMRRWPGSILVEDVRTIDRDMVRGWCLGHTQVREVHIWAGFPCKDLSSAKAHRRNLEGDQSSLFYEVPRIRKLVKEEFPRSCKIKFALENVASMDREAAEAISQETKTIPYHLDTADSMPIHRPRLCWTSEDWDGLMPGLQIVREQYWIRVTAQAEWPKQYQWVSPGWIWEGESRGAILPTAMRTVPKDRPPPHPAGLARATEEAKLRWRADDFRLPPYQYGENFIMTKPSTGQWRRPNASEKELLMGYGWGHTELCLSASDIKKSKVHYEDTRQALIGDGFAIASFLIAAAGLCREFIEVKNYSHWCQRLGMAPGFCSQPDVVIPIKRGLSYGCSCEVDCDPHLLNRLLLTKTNHTGSDVRVSSGTIVNPRAFPRQGAEACWWEWTPTFSTKWQFSEHINGLEMRSVFLAVKHQVSHLRAHDCRIFHLSDSYVSISIISKGRTSSFKLQRILQQLNSVLLAYGLILVLCHVESTQNPTDHASRQT